MHQHEWNSTDIPNGSTCKKAQKMSDGARCACGLVAKAPSGAGNNAAWLRSLPKS